MKRSLWMQNLTAILLCATLFALAGCSSDSSALQPAASKQVTVSGSLESGVAKTAAKGVDATAGSIGSVIAVDATTGKTISTAAADIVNNQFSGLTFTLPSTQSVIVLVAKLTSGPTYRYLAPIDLSNPPTNLVNNTVPIVIGPNSDTIVQSVSTDLGATGILGDSNISIPSGKKYADAAASTTKFGGAVIAYTTNGISFVGTLASQTATQFVFTSDAHYGLNRRTLGGVAFNGYSSGFQVNGAMIGVMNSLPNITFPCSDNGVNACQSVGAVDFVVEGGDIGNRSESATNQQNAATSWAQFKADYIDGLTLKGKNGKQSPLYMIPGNHDVSNAIGFYKTPLNTPAGLDATSYTQIYNLMMKPATALTNAAFVGAAPSFTTAAASYAANRVAYSKDINGVHFVFITMWPDSIARAWIDSDLASVSATTPVILFTHVQPVIETKSLANPNAPYDINATDKFENTVADKSLDTDSTGKLTTNAPSNSNQRAMVAWLKTHKNIVAYFHGNDHINGAYTYTGPDNDISLNVFRVDSPMKGTVSLYDPTQLIFKVVSIDAVAQNMTVRDYLWNTKRWGASTTVSLAPRSK